MIGIIGAGTMGIRLARCFCALNNDVTFLNPTKNGLMNIEKMRKIYDMHPHTAQLSDLQTLQDFQIIIECLPEDLELKRVYIKDCLSKGAPLVVTNTSSFSLSNFYLSADNFFRCHFMNPPTKIRTVEVSTHGRYARSAYLDLITFLRKSHFEPLDTLDSNGQVVNQILTAMFNEAIKLNDASMPRDNINLLMKSIGFPMGPFELMEFIGEDVVNAMLKNIAHTKNRFISISKEKI